LIKGEKVLEILLRSMGNLLFENNGGAALLEAAPPGKIYY